MADERRSKTIERQAEDTQEADSSTELAGDQLSDTEQHHDTADPWWTGEIASPVETAQDDRSDQLAQDEGSVLDSLRDVVTAQRHRLNALVARRADRAPACERTSPLEPIEDPHPSELADGEPWYIAGVIGAMTMFGILGLGVASTMTSAIPELGIAFLVSPLIGGLVAGSQTTQSTRDRALAGVAAIMTVVGMAIIASFFFEAIWLLLALLFTIPFVVVLGMVLGIAGGELTEE